MPKVAWHSAFLSKTTFFAVFFRVPKKAWHGHRVLGAISRFGDNYSDEQIIETPRVLVNMVKLILHVIIESLPFGLSRSNLF